MYENVFFEMVERIIQLENGKEQNHKSQVINHKSLVISDFSFYLNLPTVQNIKYAILINGNLPRKGVLFMEQIISLVIAPLLVGLIITLVDHWLDDQTIASKLLSNSHACIRNKCKEKPDLLAIGWAFVLFIRTYLVSHIHYSMISK